MNKRLALWDAFILFSYIVFIVLYVTGVEPHALKWGGGFAAGMAAQAIRIRLSGKPDGS